LKLYKADRKISYLDPEDNHHWKSQLLTQQEERAAFLPKIVDKL